MKIYMAGPLFTDAERQWNLALRDRLQVELPEHKFLLPQDFCAGCANTVATHNKCIKNILDSNLLLVNCDGVDVESGTAFEAGYAHALKIPLIAYRTDFRRAGDSDQDMNLMISKSACLVIPARSTREIVASVNDYIRKLRHDGS